MSAKLDGYSDTITRLARETVTCSPSTWRRATLSIQCDGVQITYQLKSDDSSDRAHISEELRALAEELYTRMRNSGDIWREAFLHWWRENNDLKFKIDFDYARNDLPETSDAIPERKKRWWSWSR